MEDTDIQHAIDVLLDTNLRVAERAAAALRLGDAVDTDGPALEALVQIATNHDVDERLARSVGAGVARLRSARGIIDNELFMDWSPQAFEGWDEEVGRILDSRADSQSSPG